jgi:predicted RNase H-like HicB family nuclease
MEIVFSVTQEEDGGYVAGCTSLPIVTEGDTWDELKANVRDAVNGYFFDSPKHVQIRLLLLREELVTPCLEGIARMQL